AFASFISLAVRFSGLIKFQEAFGHWNQSRLIFRFGNFQRLLLCAHGQVKFANLSVSRGEGVERLSIGVPCKLAGFFGVLHGFGAIADAWIVVSGKQPGEATESFD